MSNPTPAPTHRDLACLTKENRQGAEYVAIVGVCVASIFLGIAIQQAYKSWVNAERQSKKAQVEKRLLRYWNVFVWVLILSDSIMNTIIHSDPLGRTYGRTQAYYTKYFFMFCRDMAMTVLMIFFILRALEANIRVARKADKLPRSIKISFIAIGFVNALSAIILFLLSWLSRFSFFDNGRYLNHGTRRYASVYFIIRDLVAVVGMLLTAHSIWTVRQFYKESWQNVSGDVGDAYQHKKAERFLNKSLSIVIFCVIGSLFMASDLFAVVPTASRDFPLLCVNPSAVRLFLEQLGIWIICGSIYFWLWTGCGCTAKDPTSKPRTSATATSSAPSGSGNSNPMSQIPLADSKMRSVESHESNNSV